MRKTLDFVQENIKLHKTKVGGTDHRAKPCKSGSSWAVRLMQHATINQNKCGIVD